MLKAVIFDIKRFAIYDGPGIRTTLFFKGCSLNCLWCQNPESRKIKPELFYDKKKCINCNSCYLICPEKKINKSVDGRFSTEKKCLRDCFKCYKFCPSGAIYKVGRTYNINRLVKIVLKDYDFYELSGGGITLSGGEPLSQIDFIERFLKEIKKKHINIVVETAGLVGWKNFERILSLVDLFYYDLKIFNEQEHIDYTGYSNKIIIKNLIKLSKINQSITIRIPLIPGITDTVNNLENLILFIKKNHLKKYPVELLPYNQLAEIKYNKTGVDCNNIGIYFKAGLKTQKAELLEDRKKLFLKNNIKVRILSVD